MLQHCYIIYLAYWQESEVNGMELNDKEKNTYDVKKLIILYLGLCPKP